MEKHIVLGMHGKRIEFGWSPQVNVGRRALLLYECLSVELCSEIMLFCDILRNLLKSWSNPVW